MSRTYAHVPVSVVAQKEGHVDHNHVNGECVIFDPKTNFLSHAHYFNRKCKKVLKVERIKCEHLENGKVVRTITDAWTEDVRTEMQDTCPEVAAGKRIWMGYLTTHHRTSNIVRDNSRECICDTMPSYSDYYAACGYSLPYEEEQKHYNFHNPWTDPALYSSEPSENMVRMNLRNAATSWNSMTPEERSEFDWDELAD